MIARDEMEKSGFWDFSVEIYSRQGVEPALLLAQDRDGLEVNLILFCFFMGAQGHLLDRAQVATMREIGKRWGRGVVEPLRAARRALKSLHPNSELREELKRLELAAEKSMQAELEKSLPIGAGASANPRAAAKANLAVWLKAEGLLMTDERAIVFDVVLDQAFGETHAD